MTVPNPDDAARLAESAPDEPPITDAWIYPRAIGGAVLLALPLALAVIGALCVPGWGSL